MVIKIGFDAGHGINTPGKRTPNGEREWTFNNILAVAFENEMLKYNGVALKRFDDRSGKVDIPLIKRTDGSNAWGADYFISFHHNANTGTWGNWGGVETFTYHNPKQKALDLAKAIHPALVKGSGLKDRGIKQGNLHIVRATNCPSILIEGGFMDSLTDIKLLRDTEKLKQLGILIAQALAKHLKLSLKVPTKVVTTVPNKVLTKVPNEGVADMSVKMNTVIPNKQVDDLRKVYEKAHTDGKLTSTVWQEKAKDYSITLGEVVYLSTILVARYNQ